MILTVPHLALPLEFSGVMDCSSMYDEQLLMSCIYATQYAFPAGVAVQCMFCCAARGDHISIVSTKVRDYNQRGKHVLAHTLLNLVQDTESAYCELQTAEHDQCHPVKC